MTIPSGGVSHPADPRGRWRTLGFISIATLFSLGVWFSANAIAPALQAEFGFSQTDIAWLTMSVQLGFVASALLIAITNLADLMSARKLFAISAALAGAANAATLIVPDSLAAHIALRLLAGAFLGGVYPPGMKLVAGWFRCGRGAAIGMMVGALTIGSGSPHLLRSLLTDHWQASLLISSGLALAGGAIVYLLVRDGPFDEPATRFQPSYILSVIRNTPTRLALLGYLGHMWELYAMWAWLPTFLLVVYGEQTVAGGAMQLAALVSFLVFLAGAVGCAAAGWLADRWGRCVITSAAMTLSGAIALFIGFLPPEWAWIVAIAALLWGAFVIADSAQFSAAMTELAPAQYRGTALTFQTSAGFLLTVATIRLTPLIADEWSWGLAFAMLALGPAVGAWAMMRLRRHPEAALMAMGRR